MKKLLAILLSLISVISMVNVVSASDTTITPTLLQYEDFWFDAVGRDLKGYSTTGAAYTANAAKGFSSGWKDLSASSASPVTVNNWYVDGTEVAPYIRTMKYGTNKIYRDVEADKAIDMTTETQTKYVVSWEQYIDNNVTITTPQGSCIGLTASGTNLKPRFGFDTVEGALKLYMLTDLSSQKRSETTFATGKTYKVIMEMTANPTGTNDTIKMKAYEVGTPESNEWDIEYSHEAETLKQTVFGIHNQTTNAANSSNLIKFANYRAEALDATAIAAVDEAEVAIAAIEQAAAGAQLNNAILAAKESVNKFTASTTKDRLQAKLDAALEGKDYQELYNVEMLQYEDFAYDQLGSIQMQSLKEFFNADTITDTARGFTTGWKCGPGETWVNWSAIRDDGSTYIVPTATNAGKINRTVDENKAIKTSVNGDGYYLVTWKQYVPADLSDSNGHSLGFAYDTNNNVKPRFGITKTAEGIKPYAVTTNGAAEVNTVLTGDKWYDAVLLISANSADAWKYKMTEVGKVADYTVWDAEKTSGEFTQTALAMMALSKNTVSDTKFADYRVVKVTSEEDAVKYLNLRGLVEDAYAATITATDATKAATAAAAVDAAEAAMELMQDSNEKSIITAELAAMDSYREEFILPVSTTEFADWNEFNTMQRALNLKVESDIRHDTQAIFDTVASDNGYPQFKWQIDAIDSDQILQDGDCLIRGSVVGNDWFESPSIVIAGYKGNALAFVQIANDGEFGFNVRVKGDSFDRIKVITLEDMAAIKPALEAEDFAK